MRKKLPREIIDLPKKGFTPPLSYWLREERFQKFILEATEQRNFKELGIFKDDVIKKLLKEHKEKAVDHTRRLWAILSLASFVN